MRRVKKIALTIMAVAFLMILASAAPATELIWAPVNPSFLGGNPLNGSFLLGKAQSQDNNQDPQSDSSQSRLDNFSENLNNSILSLLSARIVEKAFGTEALPNGTFTVGDFQVTITDSISQLEVVVKDIPNNSSTLIRIPIIQ